MPKKKVRTMQDELKSILTKKKKANPMQKIKGMPKEHIIQKHDELLKQMREDLDTLANKKFLPEEPSVLDTLPGMVTIHLPPIPIEQQIPMIPVSMEKKMPEPGSREWEDMVDFMRADLECGMGYSRIINTVRKRMEEDGKDFDEEFEKWKKNKDNEQAQFFRRVS